MNAGTLIENQAELMVGGSSDYEVQHKEEANEEILCKTRMQD